MSDPAWYRVDVTNSAVKAPCTMTDKGGWKLCKTCRGTFANSMNTLKTPIMRLKFVKLKETYQLGSCEALKPRHYLQCAPHHRCGVWSSVRQVIDDLIRSAVEAVVRAILPQLRRVCVVRGDTSQDQNHHDKREFSRHHVQHRLMRTVIPWDEHNCNSRPLGDRKSAKCSRDSAAANKCGRAQSTARYTPTALPHASPAGFQLIPELRAMREDVSNT